MRRSVQPVSGGAESGVSVTVGPAQATVVTTVSVPAASTSLSRPPPLPPPSLPFPSPSSSSSPPPRPPPPPPLQLRPRHFLRQQHQGIQMDECSLQMRVVRTFYLQPLCTGQRSKLRLLLYQKRMLARVTCPRSLMPVLPPLLLRLLSGIQERS